MKRLFLYTVFCTFFVNLSAQNQFTEKNISDQIQFIDNAFSLNKDFKGLRVSLKNEWQQYALSAITKNNIDRYSLISPTQCYPAVEVPNTYLCVSYKQEDQNQIFGRISLFSEGVAEISAGTIVDFDTPWLQFMYEEVGGHDISSPAILGFFNAASEDDIKLSQAESAFKNNVLVPIVKKQMQTQEGADFHIITVSLQNAYPAEQVLSHEALHAQYFEYRSIQDAVKKYWNNHLTPTQKEWIKNQLNMIYDVENEFVLLNEFFSYSLMRNANNNRLKDFAVTYGNQLREFIEHESGIATINF
ncbi:hypothetical protein MRY82_03695 [bacterium]|nr:hypothetical protein [bacterium]